MVSNLNVEDEYVETGAGVVKDKEESQAAKWQDWKSWKNGETFVDAHLKMHSLQWIKWSRWKPGCQIVKLKRSSISEMGDEWEMFENIISLAGSHLKVNIFEFPTDGSVGHTLLVK